MSDTSDTLRLVPEMKDAGFSTGLFSMHGHRAGAWGFRSPFGESRKGFSNEAEAWRAAAETFERERKIAARYFAAAPAVQPAAGKEELALIIRQSGIDRGWAQAGDAEKLADRILAAISTPAQASGEPVKQTMTVNLTDAEMAALEELIAKKDLDGPKIFRDSFKLYQAVEKGAASVTWHETGPLGLPCTYPAHPPAQGSESGAIQQLNEVYQHFLAGDLYEDHDRASELLGKMRRAIAALSAPQAAPGEGEQS